MLNSCEPLTSLVYHVIYYRNLFLLFILFIIYSILFFKALTLLEVKLGLNIHIQIQDFVPILCVATSKKKKFTCLSCTVTHCFHARNARTSAVWNDETEDLLSCVEKESPEPVSSFSFNEFGEVLPNTVSKRNIALAGEMAGSRFITNP